MICNVKGLVIRPFLGYNNISVIDRIHVHINYFLLV